MTARLLAALVAAAVRRPRATAAAALVAMAAMAAVGSRLRLADDARALIAGGDPEIARQLEALSQFTAIDGLTVQLRSAEHPERLEGAADWLVQRLHDSGRFVGARWRVPLNAQLELVQTLAPQRFVLDPRPPHQTLEPAALARQLFTLREQLLAPDGIVGKELRLRDPLGSLAATLGPLAAAPGLPGLDVSAGTYRSRDGRSVLVVAMPAGNPFGSTDAEASMAVVDDLAAALPAAFPDVTLHVLGAHRYTRDASRMIKGDVHFSAATSILGVLLIFLLFFRRPQLALCSIPPIAFGACVGLCAAGLLGAPVHPIVLAFAGVCVSLSVDYTIHLITAVAAAGGEVRQALVDAARRLGPAMTLVMTTTLAGLGALCLSRVGALRQMGVLSMAAVLGAFVGTFVWVPVLLPRLGGATLAQAVQSPWSRGPWTWAVDVSRRHPGIVVLAALALLLGGAVGAAGLHLDGDLRHLDTHTPSAVADEHAFADAFGDPASTAMAVIEGKDLGAALEIAARLDTALRAAGSPAVLTPTTLAPPPSVWTARRAAWCADDAGAAWATRLDDAATAAGFKRGAFASFGQDLARLCGAGAAGPSEGAEAALAAFASLVERPVMRPAAAGGVRLAMPFDIADADLPAATAAVAAEPGATLVHRATLNRAAVEVIARDLPLLGLVSFALVILLLLGTFRSFVHALRALAPCALAIGVTFAVLAITKTGINLMNLCVLPLLAGIGIDYGVLMADAERGEGDGAHGAEPGGAGLLHERAFSLTVAAVTAVTDFGTLAVADYGALSTIGQSVILAVGSAALLALFVPPALGALAGRSRGRPAR